MNGNVVIIGRFIFKQQQVNVTTTQAQVPTIINNINNNNIQQQEQHTLPEGQKDDGFNGAKLQDGIVGSQQVFGGVVEEEKAVEGQGYRKVVDQRDVQISGSRTKK